MGILFIMQQWEAPSELWMSRMIEALEPHIVAIACPAPSERAWRNRIPAIALRDSPPNLLRRIGHSVGIPLWLKPRRTAADVLRHALADPAVTTVLIHYLEDALKFEEVWAQTNQQLFVHCHGYDVTWDWRTHQKPATPYFPPDYLPRVRRLSQRATIIANSHSTAQRLLAGGVPPDRIAVKYFGVPAPAAPFVRPLRTKEIEILYLGRLTDFKGPDLVIRAFELACARGLEATLTMAGDDDLRMTCELLQRRSPVASRIRLLGPVTAEQGDELRARADIFTAHNCFGPLSHQEEAFGVSIVEAMAAAIPVITGRSGSVEEIIVNDVTGILVEPGDVAAHAEAFLRLANNPDLRRQMGEAGWRRVREHFTMEKERANLLQILGLPDSPTSQSLSNPQGQPKC